VTDAREPIATSLLFEVFATSQAVGRLLADAMRDAPLTPAEYAVSSAMFELEAASPTELAARLGMPLTTLVDQLRVFERRGHVARLPHPTDRRSHRLTLTATGRAAHRAANSGFEAAHAAFRTALPAGEDRARRGLRDVRDAAGLARAALSREPAGASRRPSDGPAG
jgi:DNA-binding MarR family transcriptional regulator